MSTKKRRKVKPVNEILRYSMHILTMLINDKLGRNEIFRKIQDLKRPGINYKRDTLDTISHLKSEGLLEEIKDGQRHWQQLTPLGFEIAHLILLTSEYKKAQSQLIKIAGDNFKTNIRDFDPKVLKHILKNRGWIDQQIEDIDEILFYKHAKLGISGIMEFSGQILKDGLINRYNNILRGYDNISNLSKQLISNLIIDALSYQLEVVGKYGYNIGVMDEENLFDFLRGVGYAYPEFIFNVAKDMIVSDLNILAISKEEITQELEELKKYIDVKPILPDADRLAKLESYDDHPYGDHPKYKNDRVLITAYTEYLRRLDLS
jgi:hypothetical protein